MTGFPGVKEAHILGRGYTVNPRQGECFYLRLLLHNIRGPQSFAHLGLWKVIFAAVSARHV